MIRTYSVARSRSRLFGIFGTLSAWNSVRPEAAAFLNLGGASECSAEQATGGTTRTGTARMHEPQKLSLEVRTFPLRAMVRCDASEKLKHQPVAG